jgi:pyruvate/2-oxoglutarate dehydrogenase complex dihydrolipoamide acyltransferase (E2) component
MLFNFLQPYGLEILSRVYVFLFIFVSVALPLYRLGMTVRASPELSGAARKRLLVGTGVVAGVLLLSLAVPWHDEIKRSAVLEHSQVQTVSAVVPGFLRRIDVQEGQEVTKGQLLAVMENKDLEAELDALRLERESIEVRLRSLAATPGEEARLAVPVLRRQLAEVEAQLAGSEEKRRSLELRAPMDGIIRTPRPGQLVGRLFPARQPVVEVGCSDVPRLLIALDEKQARRVQPGQSVKVVFDGLPGEVYNGTVSSVPVSPAPLFSAASLSNLFGGDVPAEMDASSKAPVPLHPHYEAVASVDIPLASLERLRAQSSSRASIRVKKTSLAGWIRDRFFDSVHPDIRL